MSKKPIIEYECRCCGNISEHNTGKCDECGADAWMEMNWDDYRDYDTNLMDDIDSEDEF